MSRRKRNNLTIEGHRVLGRIVPEPITTRTELHFADDGTKVKVRSQRMYAILGILDHGDKPSYEVLHVTAQVAFKHGHCILARSHTFFHVLAYTVLVLDVVVRPERTLVESAWAAARQVAEDTVINWEQEQTVWASAADPQEVKVEIAFNNLEQSIASVDESMARIAADLERRKTEQSAGEDCADDDNFALSC